ncbi:unnamed protein product [Caenorhabditis nigoni]
MKILIQISVIFVFLSLINGSKNVSCPMISRTLQKEHRIFHYEQCNSTLNFCFQQIGLTEIYRNEQFSFLFSSGCASPSALLPFNLTETGFKKLCQKSGVHKCVHRYNEGVYYGTICCENDSDEMFRSWLWNIFFGENEEMDELLKNTASFVQRSRERMHFGHGDVEIVHIVGPFIVTLLFTALSLLQYYHINDGMFT